MLAMADAANPAEIGTEPGQPGSLASLPLFLESLEDLRAYLLALGGTRDDIDDALQETALSVMAEAKRGIELRQPQSWLRAIARHRLADQYRRKQRHAQLPEPDLIEAIDQSFAESPTPPGMVAALNACVERLAPSSRRIVHSHFFSGDTPAEIAIQLNWSASAVYAALSRARRFLADCVDRWLRTQP